MPATVQSYLEIADLFKYGASSVRLVFKDGSVADIVKSNYKTFTLKDGTQVSKSVIGFRLAELDHQAVKYNHEETAEIITEYAGGTFWSRLKSFFKNIV